MTVCLQMSDSDRVEWNSESDNIPDTDDSDGKEGLVELTRWAVDENISHRSIKSLLHIFQSRHSFLLLDPTTLLLTPRYVSCEKLSSGSFYHHFGFASCLQKVFESEQTFKNLSDCSQFLMQCNINGLPLFKSTGLQLWPIIGLLKQPIKTSKLFLIGIYAGYIKLSYLVEFLNSFVIERSQLEKNGIKLIDKLYQFWIHSFVCNAPAQLL